MKQQKLIFISDTHGLHNSLTETIPEGIDVLITHGPPAYFPKLSAVLGGKDVGCEDLYRAVKRINPKIHCFGAYS